MTQLSDDCFAFGGALLTVEEAAGAGCEQPHDPPEGAADATAMPREARYFSTAATTALRSMGPTGPGAADDGAA